MEAQGLGALPDSLLLRILEWLPPRDRLRGARVCRRWRCLVQDKLLWRYLDLTPYRMSSKVLWHLLRKNLQGSLRTLKARGSLYSVRKQEVFTSALMQALGKQCPNLYRLCLTETDLRSLSYDCIPSSVTTLELSSCEIPSQWFRVSEASKTCPAFPHIQHLVIQNVPAFSNQHLLNISIQGSLKSLVLSEAYRITVAGFEAAAPYLGGLEHLTLHRCSIGNLLTRVIAFHMRHLRSLDLGGSPSLENRDLICLSSLLELEKLYLDSCCKLFPEAIVAICRKLPRLRNLGIRGLEFQEQVIHKIQADLPRCDVTSAVSLGDSSVVPTLQVCAHCREALGLPGMDEENYAENFRTKGRNLIQRPFLLIYVLLGVSYLLLVIGFVVALSKAALASSEISKLRAALAKDPYGHDLRLFPCGADTRQWEYFGGKCYYFSLKAVSWHVAKAQCEQQQSQLVIINSLAKQNFIQTRTRNERYWIGLHDQHTEGEWKWLDNSNYQTGFLNWKVGEPNSYQHQDEDCGQVWINGEWNDYTCSSDSFYVCEKALPVKPTPASKRT